MIALVLIQLVMIVLVLIQLVMIALVLIALMRTSIAQKLAPAPKNSTDISARSAAFCTSACELVSISFIHPDESGIKIACPCLSGSVS